MQTAAVYDLYHFKDMGPLVDRSISGWHLNLLFPELHDGVARPALLGAWIAIVALLLLLPGWRAIRRRLPGGSALAAPAAAAWPVLLSLSLVTVVWAAHGKPDRSAEYLMTQGRARVTALRLLADHPHDRGRSSSGSRVNAVQLAGADAGHVQFAVTSASPVAPGVPATFEVRVTNGNGEAAWGHLWIDYGDGPLAPMGLVVGTLETTHTYAIPGTYVAAAHLTLPDGRWVHQPIDVAVREPGDATLHVDPGEVDGLPGTVQAAPAKTTIQQVLVGPDGLLVRHGATDGWPDDGSGETLWILTAKNGRWQVAGSEAMKAGTDGRLAAPHIAPGSPVGFLLTRSGEAATPASNGATWSSGSGRRIPSCSAPP